MSPRGSCARPRRARRRATRPRWFGPLASIRLPPAHSRSVAPRAGSCRPRPRRLSPRERGPEAPLGLVDAARGGVDLAPERGVRVLALAGGVEGAGELGPAGGGLGGQRRLGPSRLLEEARVHEAEGAAARAAALDHLVAEARAPLPVLGDLGPAARLLGEAARPRRGRRTRGTRARPSPSRRARSPPGSPRAAAPRADRARGGEHVAGERVGGVAAVAGPVEVLEAGRRLQLLEAGVGEVGDLARRSRRGPPRGRGSGPSCRSGRGSRGR